MRTDLTPQSWIEYHQGFVPNPEALLGLLVAQIPWNTNMLGNVWRPRQTFWIGDFSFSYSGTIHKVNPWPNYLLGLRSAVEALTGVQYRGVLLNHYRDGNDTIGWHSDSENEVELGSPIASVSLGATRKFRLRPKTGGKPQADLTLANGSCLVMGGQLQAEYLHSIGVEKAVREPRINLTFRKYRF